MARSKDNRDERATPSVDPATIALLLKPESSADEATRTYAIGEMASEFGLTLRTLRHYEQVGLLRPMREGTRRSYTADDRRRLRVVLLGQTIGFSLSEIRGLMDTFVGVRVSARQIDKLIKRFEERQAILIHSHQEMQRSVETMNAVMTILKGVQWKP